MKKIYLCILLLLSLSFYSQNKKVDKDLSIEKDTEFIKNIETQGLPVFTSLSPDKKFLAVTYSGKDFPTIQIIDTKTLKIKETDRLKALKNELEKLGAKVNITNQSLHLKKRTKFNPDVIIDTYEDHRMAMAFTPLALLKPIIINNPKVISKSFPSFWKTLSKLCFEISEY